MVIDFGIETGYVIIVIIIVEIIKSLGLNKRFLPILAVILGIGITAITGGHDLIEIIQQGVIIGAMAVGLYDGTRVVFSHDEDENLKDVSAIFPELVYFDDGNTANDDFDTIGNDFGLDNDKEFEEVADGYYLDDEGNQVKD